MADDRILDPKSPDFDADSGITDPERTDRSEMWSVTKSDENGANSADFDSATISSDSDVQVTTPAPSDPGYSNIYESALAAMVVPKPGDALRQVREHAGISLEELADALRIRLPYLRALERMEVGVVPSGYVTPYLRAYAGRFSLDGNRVVTSYTRATGGVATVSGPITVEKIDTVQRSPWVLRGIAAGIGLGLVAAALVAVFAGTSPDGDDQLRASAGTAPMNGARESLFAGDVLPDRLDIGALPLTLTAARTGWIEVRGADGTIFRSRIMQRGETYLPRVGAGWTVSARNGGDFEWRLGDQVIGPLGPEGAAVYAASVDIAAAAAAEAAAPSLAAAAGNGQPAR